MGHRGLTLLEVVLAAALVGIVGLAFIAIYPAAHRYLLQSSEFATNQGEAGFAMEHMRRHLLVSNCAILYNGTTIAFRYDPVGGNPSTHADDLWGGYRLSGGILEFVPNIGVAGTTNPTLAQLMAASAETPPVARHIVGLTLAQPNNAQVTITLQVQQTNLPGQPTVPGPFELNTTVTLRGAPSPSSPCP